MAIRVEKAAAKAKVAKAGQPKKGVTGAMAKRAALGTSMEHARLAPGVLPPVRLGKEPVTIRLDSDVLAAFRATGPGWQTRINDVLRRNMP